MNEQTRNYSERYSRQLRLKGFGPEAQQKLSDTKVLVVGAGGLGVPVLQYLAGMGVGSIGIVDDDVVSLSNLQRQVLYRTEDVGQPKAQVAAESLRRLNPEISLRAFPQRLDVSSALSLIKDFDIVVDATDNFAARYLINDACVLLDKPFVYGAIQGYEGQVSVFNFQDGPTYRCLFPTPPDPSSVPDCNEAGVLGVVPGIVGSIQALQVVKIATGIGTTLSGSLLIYDFLEDAQYKMQLKANIESRNIQSLQETYDVAACANSLHLLQPAVFAQWQRDGKQLSLIDVREAHEFSGGHITASQNVPLSALHTMADNFDTGLPLVIYCQKGGRSAQAVSFLRRHRPDLELYELAGGFEAWEVKSEK